MSQPENTSNSRRQRLSIGSLFIVTVWASILCSLFAASLRGLPKEQKTNGIVFIVIALVLCLGAFAYCYFRRVRVERLAGPRHYISRSRMTSWFHILGVCSCFASTGFMIFGLSSIQLVGDASGLVLWNMIYMTWMFGIWAGNYLLNVLVFKTDSRSIDVSQNGIIIGVSQFIPWTHIIGFRWNQYTDELMLLFDGNFIDLPVSPDEREALERELLKFIRKKKGY